jgi:hypothetical protein
MNKSNFMSHTLKNREITRLVKFFVSKYNIDTCNVENNDNFVYIIYIVVNYYTIHYDELFKQWYMKMQKKSDKKLKIINTLLKQSFYDTEKGRMTDILKLSLYHLLSTVFKQFSLMLKMLSLKKNSNSNHICDNVDLIFFLTTQHMFPSELIEQLKSSLSLGELGCKILTRCNEKVCYFKGNVTNVDKKPFIESISKNKQSLKMKDKIMILIDILMNMRK